MSADSFDRSAWDMLPMHLLEIIHEKVEEEFGDLIRFGAVCKRWHAAASRKLDCYKQVPLLLVPAEDGSHEKRCLYSVARDKIYDDVQLNVGYDKRCCGSSHSWLATVGDDTSITLRNPFSGKAIRFPPVIEKPMYPNCGRLYRLECHITKVIVSHDPRLHPKDYIVVVIYGRFQRLAYIKPGHKSWVYIDATPLKEKYLADDGGFFFMDAIYHEGKIFAVDYCGALISIDIGVSRKRSREHNNIPPKVEVVTWRTSLERALKAYIVVSSQGELLLVRRFPKAEDNEIFGIQWVTRFQVLRLFNDQNYGGGGQRNYSSWIEVESLGGDALFLGNNLSMSLPASKFSGISPNSIYHTDDIYGDHLKPFFPYGACDSQASTIYEIKLIGHITNLNQHRSTCRLRFGLCLIL